MTLEKLIQTLKESGQSIADSVMAPKELKITKDVVIAESIKLTSKDIYRAYWHCRDFEITHLWQRSVFSLHLLYCVSRPTVAWRRICCLHYECLQILLRILIGL